MPSFKNPSKRKKSHVTRHMREMKKREPQLVEVVKNTLVIRGQKTSEPLMELLRDLVNKCATAKSTVSCPQHSRCNTNVYVYVYVFVYVCNDSTLFKSQQQNCFHARTHCAHLRTPARSSSCVKGMTVASLHLAHTPRSDPTISSWYGVVTHTMLSVYCLGPLVLLPLGRRVTADTALVHPTCAISRVACLTPTCWTWWRWESRRTRQLQACRYLPSPPH